MMVSSLEASPKTPINMNGQVTGERVYAREGVRGHDNQGPKVRSANGPYSSMEGMIIMIFNVPEARLKHKFY